MALITRAYQCLTVVRAGLFVFLVVFDSHDFALTAGFAPHFGSFPAAVLVAVALVAAVVAPAVVALGSAAGPVGPADSDSHLEEEALIEQL